MGKALGQAIDVDWEKLKDFMHKDFRSESWTDVENEQGCHNGNEERFPIFSYHKSVGFQNDDEWFLLVFGLQ